MQCSMGKGSRIVLTLVIALLVPGCATLPAAKPGGKTQEGQVPPREQEGWWAARYGILWPENAEPNWSVDLYLADGVVGPVLERHRSDIGLWRFHRRAARDAAGHQFSFILFCSPRKAREVFNDLSSSKEFQLIRSSGLVVRDTYDDTSAVHRPRPEDTSDRSWSPAIQKAWPHFIMGVSEMWLRLIQEHKASMEGTSQVGSLAARLSVYQQVNTKITHSWRDEGRHALLHHLNALFGYEPLVVMEKKLMGF